LNPLAESLNRDYPEVREALALIQIETQLELLGAAVCRCEEDGLEGLVLQAFDVNENLSPLKITFFPLTAKSKTARSWFGAIPWDFYVRMFVEEMPELDEYTTDEKLDELFFAVFSTHQKHGADMIAFLLNSLREEYGLQLTLCARNAD
jgi:hypothetical protein